MLKLPQGFIVVDIAIKQKNQAKFKRISHENIKQFRGVRNEKIFISDFHNNTAV